MSSIMEIKDLTVDKILSNITFSIEDGTFNVLIGSSGKTTLAKSIMGLIEYSGSIIYKNELITNKNKKEIIKNIGYFRNNMLKKGTVIDNIIYPLINLKIDETEAKKRVYDICDKFKINDLTLKNIKDLTNTEKKLVSFIVSIIHNPKLIIIDDTLEEFDEINKNKILNYIKKYKITCLYLTNNEEDIIMSDNLIIIKDGKIIESGKTIDLLNNEKLFNSIGSPFLTDLSNKLKVYDIVDKSYLDVCEMIDDIWK